MIKVVQVGTGFWGTSWARDVLPTVETIAVTGYVDGNPAALAALQAELGVPAAKCFTTIRAALEAVECDVVLGALRTDAHFPVVREALEAGRHVIVEKPFTATLDEAAALNRLAAEKQRLLMVSQNYRFFRAPRAVAGLIAAGTLGEVDSIALDFRRHGPSFGFKYYEIADPLIADMSIHHFDMMRMLFGEIAAVSCRTWNVPRSPFQHDPAAFATIVFASGKVLSYRASFMSAGKDTPWGGEWAINLTGGEIIWSYRGDVGEDIDWVKTRKLRGELEEVPLADMRYRDRAGAIHAFAEAVRTGVTPPGLPLGTDNIKSLAVVKACLRSAKGGGAWVDLADVLPR